MSFNHIYTIDALTGLASLPSNSIDCVVTSPPYYSLRNYGTTPIIWESDNNCQHDFIKLDSPGYRKKDSSKSFNTCTVSARQKQGDGENNPGSINRDNRTGQVCSLCGCFYGELGLEPTPELYVKHLVFIFKEVYRVLKKEGTLWLNIGDTYHSGKGNNENTLLSTSDFAEGEMLAVTNGRRVKGKDLVGIPWMVAFALRDKLGFYLRSDIIWHKPNSMPEAVKDRPTRSHEHIFLLSKSRKYFYDHDSIKTPYIKDARKKATRETKTGQKYFEGRARTQERWGDPKGANRRDVWKFSTSQNRQHHFATYPKELIRLCVKAGCPAGGVILDPFMGIGTTALVAIEEGRQYLGLELNESYTKIAKERIEKSRVSHTTF